MYTCIIFDMDGTLVNTYEGIYHAYQRAFYEMDMPFPGDEFVSKAIGAPLLRVFEEICGLSPRDAQKAVDCYRAYYAEKGKRQLTVYPGIPETLRRLKAAGCTLVTATLKREGFAKEILQNLNLESYFDVINGMNDDDTLTKADLIRRCLSSTQTSPSHAILVGDSEYDAAGAREAGVGFLAVTYGFGFQNPEALNGGNVTMTASNAYEIAEKLVPFPSSLHG